MPTRSSPSSWDAGTSSRRADSSARRSTAGRSSGASSPPETAMHQAVASPRDAPTAELQTRRLAIRLARPGMEAAIAEFLAANYAGHLDRWSPPAGRGYFTEAFWREKLRLAVEEFH